MAQRVRPARARAQMSVRVHTSVVLRVCACAHMCVCVKSAGVEFSLFARLGWSMTPFLFRLLSQNKSAVRRQTFYLALLGVCVF